MAGLRGDMTMYFPIPEYGYWPEALEGRKPNVSVATELAPAVGCAKSLHLFYVDDWTIVTSTCWQEGAGSDWRFPGRIPSAIARGEYVRAWHLAESTDGNLRAWQELYGPSYNGPCPYDTLERDT